MPSDENIPIIITVLNEEGGSDILLRQVQSGVKDIGIDIVIEIDDRFGE